MLILTAAQMRDLDRETIEGIGVPGAVLMESAGRGVIEVMARVMDLERARVIVFCGPGNNGGDGFVVARHLANRGVPVEVALCAASAKIAGDARIHLDACQRSGVPILFGSGAATLADGDVLVDALLGTGLTRPVTGMIADAITRINHHRGPKIAVDIPSGLDSDRGVPLGPCVRADHTVTFAFAKVGLVSAPGFTYAGQLHVADIGIPEWLARRRGIRSELLDARVLASLRSDDPLGHKGTHGHVLVVAGSRGKSGAALLCGTAVLRAGAGLCTVAMPIEAALHAEGLRPELMIEGYRDGEASDLMALTAGKRAIAVGPGVPRDPWMVSLIGELCATTLPLVLDADALNHLAAHPKLLAPRSAPTVLTPHPGEAARLLDRSPATVQADRIAAARAIAERFGAITVLKGARTIIVAPDGRLAICPSGNPGLGTGGTGDVLTGCIAAALARAPVGSDGFAATAAAVYLHGAAGDRAARARGQTGLLAGDVVDALPSELAGR
jgi:NAD(P)H-hydrate epimerase